MPTQKAVITQARKAAKVVSDAPVPTLRHGYIKVKTVAVSLNPTDWKQIDMVGAPGCLVGCDYAGIVVEIGAGDTSNLEVGDNIAGFAHGSNTNNHEDGTFAEYIMVKASLAIKVPETLSMEQAATIGIGITTVGQGLYQSLGLPLPTEPAVNTFSVLIYGGGTAAGSLAIQFAKLSGLEVITTCSSYNIDLMKNLGADAAFDYNSPTVGADIRAATNNSLAYVFDCQADTGSVTIAAQAIGSQGGKYSSLLHVPRFPRNDVTNTMTLAYTAIGEDFDLFGKKWTANPDHLRFSAMFWKLAEGLLAKEKIKTHPVDARDGGLEGVLRGLDEMRQGKVRGRKLVYRL